MPSPTPTAMPTIALTNTAAPTPTIEPSPNCTPLTEGAISATGSLLVWGESDTAEAVLLKTLDTRPTDVSIDSRVSPSGNTVSDLIEKDDGWVLRLLTRDGSKDIPLGGNVDYAVWVNDHVIALRNSADRNADILLLDLLTNKTTKLRISRPESHEYFPPLIEHWKDIPYLDPSLQYAIYPTDYGINIVRLSNGELMGKVDLPAAPHPPKWSPTGAVFIDFVLPGEIAVIDSSGHMKQLTNITSQYPGAYIEMYQWSPDASRVAYWLRDYAHNSDLLGITQIVDGQTQILCIKPGKYVLVDYSTIWSPDGRYLAINLSLDNGDTNQIYVVDTKEFRYTIVPGNNKVWAILGWIAFDPVK